MVSYEDLKKYLTVEILKEREKFSWRSVLSKCRTRPKLRYLFWWRIANYLHHSDGKFKKKIAKYINRKISLKYNTEIGLDAIIGPGLNISHYNGIVISGCCVAGKNFTLRQNTVIAIKKSADKPITFGDNVKIGTFSCIIGEGLTIGDNVEIGAMSFINKNIPSNCLVYTEKTNTIKYLEATKN